MHTDRSRARADDELGGHAHRHGRRRTHRVPRAAGAGRPADDLVALAREIADASANPGEAAREICALVYREVKYVSGSTTVDAFAAHSWAERPGSARTSPTSSIGALRSIGIPARYVSGYLHPKTDPVVGEPVSGESHAWVEWWDDGWRGFDPTNDTEPGDRHVIVAQGRDYNDVKPLPASSQARAPRGCSSTYR